MKKLTLKQMCKIVDFLTECYEDYEDDYSLSAVNNTLKILGYSNIFHYNYENDAFTCKGGIATEDKDE